jgi:NAD-dependent deacetylase
MKKSEEYKPFRQKIVVLTGAGISAESGLATFRDNNGLWKQNDAKKLASAAGFEENPQAVLDFYNYRRQQLLEVEPNHAHKMLAELEKWHDVTIITQNVDNLHERAGSSHVIHLHGELTKVTSSKDRLNPCCIKEYPLDKPICLGDKAEDGSQLRPFIVWFGEYVYAIEVAMDYVREADIFVVIGTSLTVHPAANLVKYAHPEIPKFIIDPNTKEVLNGFMHIKESATKGVDKLIEELRKL